MRRITFLSILAGLFVFAAAIPSHAIFELRVNYGFNFAAPKKLNDAIKAGGGDEIKSESGLGFDGLFNIPMIPIGFGLRYEKLSTTGKQGGSFDYETGFSRLGLLVNYRLIDTGMYAGPIASIGFSDSATYSQSSGGSSTDFTSSNKTSFSIGFEGGAKFDMFMLGGELGYLSANYGVPKNNSNDLLNSSGESVPLDFSGVYAKIQAGFSF